MDRRKFLLGFGAFFSVITVFLAACNKHGFAEPEGSGTVDDTDNDDGDNNDDDPNSGDPEDDPGSSTMCQTFGTTAVIGTNHSHSLTVPAADVTAGVTKTYNIQGGSGHNHTVTISAIKFLDLRNNNAISVFSSSDSGHTHNVNVSCQTS